MSEENSKKNNKINSKNRVFTFVYGYETKEDKNGNLIRGGYIATTHLDSGFYDEEKSAWVRDKIAKETLDLWAKEINEGNPRANKVSINHNREPHVAGVGIKGSARVDKLPDGEYGLYVDTLVDKTKENFNETQYKIENGLLDSFSIEFMTKDLTTGTYLENAVRETPIANGSGYVRELLPGTQLEGWTLASQPMNEHAVMIKEISKLGGNKMEKKEEAESKPSEEETQEQPVEEAKEIKPKDKKKPEDEEEEMSEEEKKKKKKDMKKEVSEEDLALLKEAKERKKMEAKEEEYKAIVAKVKEELKESLKDVQVESKTKVNTESEVETKEVKNYVEAFKSKDIDMQFKAAAKLAESKGFFKGDDWKSSGMKPGMEAKGLGITTNQNTDTDYLLSAAELSDVFDPVIYNYLNQETMTWNILAKDDYSGKGNNQVQFTLKTARNTTASFYTGNSVTTGNVSRQKYQTKFKKAQVGVEVDGDMIAAARGGPIGDIFAQEVKDSVDDLMEVLNQALFAEVGLETASGVIGFEYLADSAGNTTLYNVTRSAANLLAPDSPGDTYIDGASADVSLGNLKKMIRQAREEGAQKSNLVFITSFVQEDKFEAIYEASERHPAPTSSRFGFEGLKTYKGIPIFADKDCNDDDWFLVDLETHRIAMWVQPTLEMLGKDGDSEKGFVKTYFAVYNRAPRRLVMCYGNATA